MHVRSGNQEPQEPASVSGEYHDAETDLFQNWNRFYDPAIGRYLEAEPLLDHPTSAPAYAYAENAPIVESDPTGLYALHGNCDNWDAALQIARQWARCCTNTPKDKACKDALPKGCDVCEILKKDSAPDVFVGELPGANGHTNVGAPGSFYRKWPGHDEPDSVKLNKITRCTKTSPAELGKTLFHEAIHWCGKQNGHVYWESEVDTVIQACKP